MPHTNASKQFLIAPLDWGLGHATRCIPVIRALQQHGHQVLAATRGDTQKLLSAEFPGIECVPITGYNISYSSHPLLLMLKFPFMVARVYRCAALEHAEIEKIVSEKNIDCVISDQRFGCYSNNAYSVYISHQLCVKMPGISGMIEKAVSKRLRMAAERYNELWIPDREKEPNLTGDLAKKYPLPKNAHFIGILSRFSGHNAHPDEAHTRDLLVMLSGPEPQRTMFELKILNQLSSFDGTATVLRGTPQLTTKATMGKNIEILPHLPTSQTAKYLAGAKAVVCRGGYTTIMELVSLGKKAILVPTPGQTEQQYLCNRLASQGMFIMQKQSKLNIHEGIKQLQSIKKPDADYSSGLLDAAVDNLFSTMNMKKAGHSL